MAAARNHGPAEGAELKRAAAAVDADEMVWERLRSLPIDVQKRIVATGDVLEVFEPLQASLSDVRLAAQLWRSVCVLSRDHRRAAELLLCTGCLLVRFEACSAQHPKCPRLTSWQQLAASQPHMRGPSSGLLELWTRMPALADRLRPLRRLTLLSVPDRGYNSFDACKLPELPSLTALRLLDFSRMHLAGLPAGVKRVTLVPPSPLGHFTACWLAPLGSLPTHRLDSLTIGRHRKPPPGQCHAVVALSLERLCRAARTVMVHGSHTVLCLPAVTGAPPRRAREVAACRALAETFLGSGALELALAMQPTDKLFVLQPGARGSRPRASAGAPDGDDGGCGSVLRELAGCAPPQPAAAMGRPSSLPDDLAVACAVACAAALARDCTAAFRAADGWAAIQRRLPRASRRRLLYMRQNESAGEPLLCGLAKREEPEEKQGSSSKWRAVRGRLVAWAARALHRRNA